MLQKQSLLEKLGIDISELVGYVKRMKNCSEERKEFIMDRADKIIKVNPDLIQTAVVKLCYNVDFLRKTGIDYNKVDREESRLIKASIADYLLTHQQKSAKH